MATTPRDDALRKRYRRRAKALHEPCHLCGGEIDYTLRPPDPFSFAADHVIPVYRGGADEWSNLAASHRGCNRAKGSRLPDEPVSSALAPPRTYVTWRTW